MATQFTIDDAFALEVDEEETISGVDADGWNSRDKDREAELTFGPLTFSKPQPHPSPVLLASPEHSNLKYQVRRTYPTYFSLTKTHLLYHFLIFSRIWKMKTHLPTMAILLLTTSSKSGWFIL